MLTDKIIEVNTSFSPKAKHFLVKSKKFLMYAACNGREKK